MTLFLTSSPTLGWAGPLNPANDFVDLLKQELPEQINCLMISSFPDDVKITDRMAWELRECFENAEMAFDKFEVLDRRTAGDAAGMVARANFIILCGGHVPTENAFFAELGLPELMHGFDGVVMGISAGSMNCASWVYSPPELDGEAKNPTFSDHFPGLGLTSINVMPHFQDTRSQKIDGISLLRDILAPNSFVHDIYCLPDGSFFLIKDGKATLCGEAWFLRMGSLRKLNQDGQRRTLRRIS